MKILALGATGAIGRELIAQLSGLGHEIHVTSRQPRDGSGPVRFIRGDARDDAFLHTLLRQNWDVIVDFMIYDTAGFRRRVQLLLDATDQYIFTSTARVFADSGSLIEERSPRLLDVVHDVAFLSTDEYALTKARQEDMLRGAASANWTIIRPYITFGAGRLQLGTLEKEVWLLRALQGRSIVFCSAMMDKWTTMTDGGDVAGMIAALVGNPAALGEDYNLTGNQSLRWGDVLDLYLNEIEAHLGERPRVAFQDVDAFCGWTTAGPQVRYDRVYNRRFNPAKISAHFNISGLSDVPTALRLRLQAQLNTGHFLPLDWRQEALRDRMFGEHARLNNISDSKQRLRYLLHRHVPQRVIRMVRAL